MNSFESKTYNKSFSQSINDISDNTGILVNMKEDCDCKDEISIMVRENGTNWANDLIISIIILRDEFEKITKKYNIKL